MLVLTLAAAGVVSAQPQQPDQICQLLFDAYMRGGKIDSDTIGAAMLIIAARGRASGFWRNVLDELRKGNDNETACVEILGRMLAVDAAVRDRMQREKETGQIGQSAEPV